MKMKTISTVMAVAILLAACGKKNASPVAEPAMSAWQQGDKSMAVSRFLAADWSRRPLFASDSVLSLTEHQFAAFQGSERQAKSDELKKQSDSLMLLASTVGVAGYDAASKGDVSLAKRYYTSMKQCGTAMNNPDYLSDVQFAGLVMIKEADTELAKLGK